MNEVMEEEIKRWTARRKSALVLEIIHGKTAEAAASRQFDLTPVEIDNWVEDGERGMENAVWHCILCAQSQRIASPILLLYRSWLEKRDFGQACENARQAC